ncbi:MAG: NADH-quinone oxidoreductase subunit A [Planctomycetota bacterium]
MALPDVTISSLVAPLAVGGGDPRAGWLPVALLLVIAIGFAVTNLIVSLIVGPSRTGPGKETTYESGMAPVGSTRRRFNVRFYLVAILFVAFDVEIVILYPWASSFAAAVADNSLNNGLGTLMLGGMLVFTLLIVVGYAYDVGKGVLKFE